jgi:carbonic anhydrase/acetyltransferase-like protein (isoleucine patch superfamily)
VKSTVAVKLVQDILFDFGAGLVKAHRHPLGGGWVADTAEVDDKSFVSLEACVYGVAKVTNSVIEDNARILGGVHDSQVKGNSLVSSGSIVMNSVVLNSKIHGCIRNSIIHPGSIVRW